MNIFDQVKRHAIDSKWTSTYLPHDTYAEIVTDSFGAVKQNGRNAHHCNYDDLYTPFLGELRKSKSYSSLAPVNGMEHNLRYTALDPDMRSYRAYKPKQLDWTIEMDRNNLAKYRVNRHLYAKDTNTADKISLLMLPIKYRSRLTSVPADNTRFDNFALYWQGRTGGIQYYKPFLPEKPYSITEDRRYQRLYWAPSLLDRQHPTCRHGRQRLLTAY
uniref:Hemoglobin and hemoglobin-haptoglobin-binding protein 2 n=1 Tax=Parastrongyloides trichosuri TaxID=131310 RepID=A0A0N4ZB60_PARTI